MPRPVNAVDFWRGFALVTIFINHIPGIFYEKLTHRNYSLSDSAELFVFLAGWSLRHVVGRPEDPTPTHNLVFRLGGRAIIIYAAHMTIVMLAIAMLGAAAIILENPLILEWHNAAAVFNNPVETHIGLVLLSHQLGYFDILPLYVVLMLFAPLVAIVHRQAPNLLVPISRSRCRPGRPRASGSSTRCAGSWCSCWASACRVSGAWAAGCAPTSTGFGLLQRRCCSPGR
jgi:hypothetical protein